MQKSFLRINLLLIPILWFLLIFISKFSYQINFENGSLPISNIIEDTMVILCFGISFFYMLFRSSSQTYDKVLFLILSISFLGLALTDVNFDIVFNILGYTSPDPQYTSIYVMPYLFFIVFQLLFWNLYLRKSNKDDFGLVVKSLILILTILCSAIFVFGAVWAIPYNSFQGIYDIITSFIDIYLVQLIIVSIAIIRNNFLKALAIGVVLILATNLWEKQLMDGGQQTFIENVDIFWTLGVLIILNSLIFLVKKKDSLILSFSTHEFKNLITMIIYFILVISFVMLFGVGLSFKLINTNTAYSFPFFLVIYSSFVSLIANFLGKYITKPFIKMNRDIQYCSSHDISDVHLTHDFRIKEFNDLQAIIKSSFASSKKQKKIIQNQASLAAQVVHDIRSPVTAIKILANDDNDLNDCHNRKALHKATSRVIDIIDDLFSRNDQDQNCVKNHRSHILVHDEITNILIEKKIEYKERNISFKLSCDGSQFIYIVGVAIEFKRMISNLINNSVQSIKNKGSVVIELLHSHSEVKIIIQDSGIAIPDEILDKINNNKPLLESTYNHGYGLKHAQQYMKEHNGYMYAENFANGSRFYLIFPETKKPNWVTHNIKIGNINTIYIIDDDISMHAAWKLKLQDIILSNKISLSFHTSYTSYKEALSSEYGRYITLSDYDLKSKDHNGLDVLMISKYQKYLVTSYSENRDIIFSCIKNGIQLIPKATINDLEIKFVGDKFNYDLFEGTVCIDDSQDIINSLSTLAKGRNKKINFYMDPATAIREIPFISKDSIVCVDLNLSGQIIDGLDVLKVFYSHGFNKLYLMSGDTNFKNIPDYINTLTSKMQVLDLC